MKNELIINAYAKINLALDVLGKRRDGYHEVAMIMQGISLHDTVSLSIGEEIDVVTNIPSLAGDKTNLAYKAAALLRDRYAPNRGVHIELVKNIPIAAGLAGGSSDAAAVLSGVNKLWDLQLTLSELLDLGAELGSDVPFCLTLGTMLATGRGEVLSPLPDLSKCCVVLAKPQVSVATAWVYRNYRPEKVKQHPDIQGMIASIKQRDLYSVVKYVANVLESVTIPVHPQIQQLKDLMKEHGALASLMSGSGPTVFGITPDVEQAQHIVEVLKQQTTATVILAHTVEKMGDRDGTAFTGKTRFL